MTDGIDYGLLDIGSERTKLVDWLAGRLVAQSDLPPAEVQRAAELVVAIFQNDLWDAWAYRWLRHEICKTMADPDGWDYDEAETSALMRYVRHLVTATHGDCNECGRRIRANEHYELVGRTRGGDPIVACVDCV